MENLIESGIKNADIKVIGNGNENDTGWKEERVSTIVKIVDGLNWKFQFENYFPINVSPGEEIFIPANSPYRMMRAGSEKTKLKIKIIELE